MLRSPTGSFVEQPQLPLVPVDAPRAGRGSETPAMPVSRGLAGLPAKRPVKLHGALGGQERLPPSFRSGTRSRFACSCAVRPPPARRRRLDRRRRNRSTAIRCCLARRPAPSPVPATVCGRPNPGGRRQRRCSPTPCTPCSGAPQPRGPAGAQRTAAEAGTAEVLPELVEDRDRGVRAGVRHRELHGDVGGGEIVGERGAAVHVGRSRGRGSSRSRSRSRSSFANQGADGERVPRLLAGSWTAQPLRPVVPRHGIREPAPGHGRLAGLQVDGGGQGSRPVAVQAPGEAAVLERGVEFRGDVRRRAERQLHRAREDRYRAGSEAQHVRRQPGHFVREGRPAAPVPHDAVREGAVHGQFERFAIGPTCVRPRYAGQRPPGVREVARRRLRRAARERQAGCAGVLSGRWRTAAATRCAAPCQPRILLSRGGSTTGLAGDEQQIAIGCRQRAP